MAYVNKQNLSDFWTNAKRYIAARDADQCDWTSIPVNASSYQFEAEPRTPVNPVVEFGFTETPPAEGEKGPDNPSAIAGVDSVSVGRIGKNLLLRAVGAPSGYTISRNDDGSLSISGSGAALFAVTDSGPGTNGPFSSYRLDLNKQYTLSVEVVSGSFTNSQVNLAQSSAAQKVLVIPSSGKASLSFTPATSYFVDGRFVCRFLTNANSVATNAVLKVQLEEGGTATSFEAPMLPAEAIATVNFGETRYGGTLDVATGKMMVEWEGMVLTGEETITEESQSTSTGAYQYGIKLGLRYAEQGYDVCTHFLRGTGTAGAGRFYVRYTGGTGVRFFTDISTVQGFADFLAAQYANGTPVVFAYKLATPVTIDLDPQQLFSALSNSKVNTVFTDTGTISQLTYAKPAPRQEDVFRYANWHRTEAAGAVACCPVPESELQPVVNFSFTETPPAEGEKGPENPSSIAGVNEVKATRCGKNLITFPYFSSSGTVSGVAFTVNSDGSFTLNGTNTSNSSAEWYCIRYGEGYRKRIPAGTYTCSAGNTSGSWETYYIRFEFTDLVTGSSTSFYNYNMASKTFTFTNPQNLWVQILVRAGQTVSSQTFTPQIESASSVSSYELFEGSDYTVNLNGTYYGGSIDLSTGLMTVTWVAVELNGIETWDAISSYNSTTGIGLARCYPENIGLRKKAALDVTLNSACTHFSYLSNFGGTSISDGTVTTPRFFYTNGTASNNGQARFAVPYSDVADFKAWLAAQKTAGTPVMLTYKIYEPFTVQLTPQQIKALPALDKYSYRVNTLYTDADSIQVGYMKSPIKTEEEFNNAILALGGNL